MARCLQKLCHYVLIDIPQVGRKLVGEQFVRYVQNPDYSLYNINDGRNGKMFDPGFVQKRQNVLPLICTETTKFLTFRGVVDVNKLQKNNYDAELKYGRASVRI